MNKKIEELLKIVEKETKKTAIPPRKFDHTKDGKLLLNPSDPFDRDWFNNDKAYDIIGDLKNLSH
jgi:hypothetical protein